MCSALSCGGGNLNVYLGKLSKSLVSQTRVLEQGFGRSVSIGVGDKIPVCKNKVVESHRWSLSLITTSSSSCRAQHQEQSITSPA